MTDIKVHAPQRFVEWLRDYAADVGGASRIRQRPILKEPLFDQPAFQDDDIRMTWIYENTREQAALWRDFAFQDLCELNTCEDQTSRDADCGIMIARSIYKSGNCSIVVADFEFLFADI